VKLPVSDSQHRLQEIVGVLKKHNIVKGLTPEKLRLILEDMGPTFVKLGQIMSMRNDILPTEYCKELEKLRADVKPMPLEQVREVIQEEYGRPLEDVFSSFDEHPLGSASIAQVHAATLHDGRRMVVKVQRPHIRETMTRDMSLLRTAVKPLKLTPISGMIDFNMVLDELWSVSQQEMDFLVEARHAEEFYERSRDVAFATCPKIEDTLTTSKVLVMEYIDGFSICDIQKLEENGYDRNEIGRKLTDHYIKQVIDDGFFHADPHPGNIRIREGQIVWIDMGMMGRLTNRDKQMFKCAIKAVVERDVNELKRIVLQMGVYNTPINQVQLYADIDGLLDKYCSMDMGDVDMGKVLEELMMVASSHKIAMPKGVSMLARGLLTIEGVVATVSPELNIVEVAADHIKAELRQEFDPKKEAAGTAGVCLQQQGTGYTGFAVGSSEGYGQGTNQAEYGIYRFQRAPVPDRQNGHRTDCRDSGIGIAAVLQPDLYNGHASPDAGYSDAWLFRISACLWIGDVDYSW